MTQIPKTLARVAGRLALALLSALCFAAYAWAPAIAFLNYVALVPWVILYTDTRRPRVSAMYYIVSVWVAFMSFYRVAFKFGWWTPPLTAIIFTVPWLLFATVLRRIHHRFGLPRTLSVPVVWVAFEWLRATFTLGHFDLFLLGYSQAKFPLLIQVADVTGVYGVSFLLAALSGFLADVFFAWRCPEHERRPKRRLAVSGAALAVALAATVGYGAIRVARATNVPGPRLAVVQPNILHTLWNQVGVHLRQVVLTDRMVPEGSADLIVWPENAILDHIEREGVYLEDLKWLAAEKNAWLLVGAMGKREDRPGKTTNSAFLVDASGRVAGKYDKQVLFPWTEYIPADDLLGRVSPFVQRLHRSLARRAWGSLSPGVPGDRMTLFSIPWDGGELSFAALICVENSYPPLPASAGRMGARLLVNITSEGEVAGLIQEQLLRVCMLRAVENRAAYVRCGNTGVSGIIDPQGRVRALLRGERGGTVGDTGVLIDRVPLSDRRKPTAYVRSRDAFAKACGLVTLVLFVSTFLRPRRVAALALLPWLALGLAGCANSPLPGSDPGDSAESLRRGLAMFERGRRSDAVAHLADACGDPNACRRAMPYMAEALRSSEEFEQGADFFAAVAEKYPNLAGEALGYRAAFLEKAGLLLDAEAEFRESLALTPSARIWAMLGALRLRLEDREGAVEAFEQGLRLAPKDAQILYALGRALWLQRDLDGAKTKMLEVIEIDPNHAKAWATLGRVRMVRGDLDPAEDAFRRAILAEPDNIEARFMLTRMALQAGDYEKAERWLDEIQKIEATLGRGPRELQ